MDSSPLIRTHSDRQSIVHEMLVSLCIYFFHIVYGLGGLTAQAVTQNMTSFHRFCQTSELH